MNLNIEKFTRRQTNFPGDGAPRFVQFYFDISPQYESGCRFQVGDIVVHPILGGLDHRYARI
jgi:hypothetical protein